MKCIVCQKTLFTNVDMCEECEKNYGTKSSWIKALMIYEHPRNYKKYKKIRVGK